MNTHFFEIEVETTIEAPYIDLPIDVDLPKDVDLLTFMIITSAS